MAFAQDDLGIKQNAPTLALKTTDNFKFSQLVETAKDVFVRELREFLSQPPANAVRFSEPLNIEKYAFPEPNSAVDPYETLLSIIRVVPDYLQKLPLIAVTQAGGSQRPIGLGGAFVDHVQLPPRLRSSNAGTYDLSALWGLASPPQLVVSTQPNGVDDVTSTLLLPRPYFPTPAAVTARQIADVISRQALYMQARSVDVSGSNYLELVAGGPIKMTHPSSVGGSRAHHSGTEPETPSRIEILAGSTADLLTALGFTVSQSDDSDNAARPPANRYATSANFTVGLDVGATSDNERTEITDLLLYFLNIYLNDKRFTFYGQHVFEDPAAGATTERYFQIILNSWNMVAETDIPRPGAEGEDKIYATRFNIPIIVYDYVDRIVPTALIPPVFEHGGFNVLVNDQPENVTGVLIKAVSDDTLSGTGTLTFTFSGTTLEWEAPSAGTPGAAQDVSSGGTYVLDGGDGSTIRVDVSASGIPTADESDSIEITRDEVPGPS